jgi:hypothetical protein
MLDHVESAMRIFILAALAAMLAASPAMARCYTVPDNAASHYVNRSVGRTICLQDDLSATQQRKQMQTDIETQLNAMQQQLQRQKFDQMMQSNGF